MHLNDEQFLSIIAATPLVSIDLILRNSDGDCLLGKRANRPAQGFWFVPGGRIRKGERVMEAYNRICQAEIRFVPPDPKLVGVFDHIYPDNFLGKEGVGTQYVVLAYEALIPADSDIRSDSQHSELRWWPKEQLSDPQIHPNTQAYFRK